MIGSRSRRLSFLVVLTLLPVAGCGGDDTPTRSAAGGRERAAAGAPESTVLETGSADPSAGNPDMAGSSAAPRIAARSTRVTTAPDPTPAGGRGTATTSPGQPTTTTTAPVGACPDPRGCPNYKLLGGRWPRDANGVATIHYRVKTNGHAPVNSPPITPDQLVAAVRDSAQTWMDAVPSVRLVFDGTTDEAPNSSNNIIGWGATTTVIPGGAETRFTPGPAGPTYTGFSVYLYPAQNFSYRPCDPAHGPPCDNDPNLGFDLQGTLAHEWGHVLGLDHVNDQPNTAEMTMYSVGGNGRHYVTLGLGDILGARSLYPTNAPMPTLYRP